jgi:hypothetical protein
MTPSKAGGSGNQDPAAGSQDGPDDQLPAGGGVGGSDGGGSIGPSLETIPSEIRPWVEKGTAEYKQQLLADYTRKTQELSDKGKGMESTIRLLAFYRDAASHPLVQSAIGAVSGRQDFIDPRYAHLVKAVSPSGGAPTPGAAPADELPQDLASMSTEEYTKWLLGKNRSEIQAEIRAALAPVVGQLGSKIQSFENKGREERFSILSQDFPTAAGRRQEIFDLADKPGMDFDRAFYAVMGPDIQKGLEDRAEKDRREAVTKARGLDFGMGHGSVRAVDARSVQGDSFAEIMADMAKNGRLPSQQQGKAA